MNCYLPAWLATGVRVQTSLDVPALHFGHGSLRVLNVIVAAAAADAGHRRIPQNAGGMGAREAALRPAPPAADGP